MTAPSFLDLAKIFEFSSLSLKSDPMSSSSIVTNDVGLAIAVDISPLSLGSLMAAPFAEIMLSGSPVEFAINTGCGSGSNKSKSGCELHLEFVLFDFNYKILIPASFKTA